ncbi:MAG: Txe/YoeB family addiction module toxin [Congregibacter sp.]
MRLIFAQNAWEDCLYWQRTDKQALKRIRELIKDIAEHPFEGLGNPESLKHALSGYWSRRITEVHRLVYRVQDDDLFIVQLRYHH